MPGNDYSVLLIPPMIAGLQSLAHLNMEEKILRMRQFNIVLKLLTPPLPWDAHILRFLQPSHSSLFHDADKLLVAELPITVCVKQCENNIKKMVRQVYMSHSSGNMFHGGAFYRCSSYVVEGQGSVYVVDGVKDLKRENVLIVVIY